MNRLHLAELRDSWTAWLGVSMAFIVTNFALVLSALTANSGWTAVRSGSMAALDSAAFTFIPASNIAFCAVVGAVVIGSSTSLVVDSRRGSLARLALSGATPRQVVATVMSQLAVVSLACSVAGGVVAYAVLRPTLAFLAYARKSEEGLAAPPAVYAAWPALLAVAFAVGLALLGGLKQARVASRIPPVEALRQSTGGSEDRITPGRMVRAVLCLAIIVGAYAGVPAMTASSGKETFSNVFLTATALLVVTAALLAQVAPLLVGPLTRGWTRLIPSWEPTWALVRATTVVKAARLTKSVVPVMMAIGLTFGMAAMDDVVMGTVKSMGLDGQVSGGGTGTTVILIGLPLTIAMAGGVGSLVMMSKQRSAELALSGIVGTTPGQRLAMPALEGVVITVTGALMSLVMVAVTVVFMAVGLRAGGLLFSFSPSYVTFAVALAVSMLAVVAATVLPTLASLRLPEPRVIARLVAE